MNHIYRSIWNSSSNTFVAASEVATSTGKRSSACLASVGHSDSFSRNSLAVLVMLAFSANVLALPAGGVVATGSASIQTGGNATTITQSSQNAVLNWQSFNIAPSETVRFIQPSSTSVVLNRVLGADPSSILGNLSANGKVFLVNPNGVLFGRGASVNVGGLVASTLNIADVDFMAKKYLFSGDSKAQVLNQGSIHAPGGYVALLGAEVKNQGVIAARMGSVALAAGHTMTLDMAGDGLLNVAVDQGAVHALAENGGLIQADGGTVLLRAQGVGSLLQSAVNNTGVIQAQSLENHNGSIRLMGGAVGGTVTVSGTLDVTGKAAGQTGGRVVATAEHVALLVSHINAQGDVGGGEVLIGGDYQGKNAALQNASATFMDAGSSINADALTQGKGGKVILWADEATRAYGAISTRGGTQGGDGGLIETSGHYLDTNGLKADASAKLGKAGTWLLDPNNITIQAAGAETNVTAGPNFTSTDDAAVVTTATILTALNAGTSVTVATSSSGTNAQAGNIVVNDTLTYTAVAGPTLTLNAQGNVIVNSAITATTGSLAVNAGGNITIAAATTVTTGNINYKAAGNVDINAPTTVTTGTISAIAGGNVTIAAGSPMTVTTGDIVLRADNDGTGPGAVVGGTVAVNCAANCLTITTGNLRVRFNPVSYAATAAEIAGYGTKLTGGGALDAKAWVFGAGDNKVYDATTAATVSGLKPDIGGVAPAGAVIGAISNAHFDTKDVGTNKLISYDSTFSNATFELFAPLGTAPGTYTTRANITPAPLTITASPDTKTYNAAPYSGGNGVTYAAFAGGETAAVLSGAIAYAGTAQGAVNAGSFAITPGGQSSSNYAITYVSGVLTVNPAPLTVTASNVAKVYGQVPTLNAFTTAGLVGGDTVASVTQTSPGTVATASVAGSPYVITPSGATGTFIPGNYTLSYVNGQLTVTPAPLTVTANSVTKNFGEVPVLSGFTSSPLANGETIGTVTQTSAGQAANAIPSSATYPIVASNAAGGTFNPTNYTIAYLDGALTVLGAVPVVTPPGTPFEGPATPPPFDALPLIATGAGPLQRPELMTLVTAQAEPTAAPETMAQDEPLATPIIEPVQVQPTPYVAPYRPRKQDRN